MTASLRVRPELVDDVGALVGPQQTQGARAIAGGTDNCTGLRGVDGAVRPSVRGVSQSVGLSTSQYRYGPTRTSCPCE